MFQSAVPCVGRWFFWWLSPGGFLTTKAQGLLYTDTGLPVLFVSSRYGSGVFVLLFTLYILKCFVFWAIAIGAFHALFVS